MNNSSKPQNRGRYGRFGKRSIGTGFNRFGSNRGRFSGGRGQGMRGRFGGGRGISHEKFINKNPKAPSETTYTALHTFFDFGFDQLIVENLTKKGYKNPTRIQDESIPHVLAGKDLIGLANTGTGKTAAFVLPIVQKMLNQTKRSTALIIAPTRELAEQIREEFKQFANKTHLYSTLCVGGLNIRAQINDLRRGCDVVIGTPGRLKDLINKRELRLDRTNTLVLDEADRMLDMGFLPDIKFILEKLPKERQSLCFSATISPEISNLLDKMLSNPVTVSVRTTNNTEHIAQDIIKTQTKEDKMKELTKMLAQDHFQKVLIFGQMKHGVQRLADALTQMNFPAVAIHGNKSQSQRQRALEAFKTNKVNILVATDVAARGLDIPNVSHVINFDQPKSHDDYIHRIGRTGRAGKTGQAYTFVE